MPVSMPAQRHRKLTMEEEMESLAIWKKKTRGVTSYIWDGQSLAIKGPHGHETFNRETVEAVIFANFTNENRNVNTLVQRSN